MNLSQSQKMSVIVPIFNEERQLREVLQRFFTSTCPIEREWILINDCSTDRTAEILVDIAKNHPVVVVHQPVNRGKGAALREGIRRATGDIIMFQDADFEYDPRDIPALLDPLLRDEADVVYGSRFKSGSYQVHRTYHYFVNRLLTFLSNLLSGIYLTDMETCFKLFRADLLKSMNLRSNRFGVEIELTAYVAKTAARVFELPISYYPRTRLQGKKITWKDGIAALFHLVRFNTWVRSEDAFSALPPNYSVWSGQSQIRRHVFKEAE